MAGKTISAVFQGANEINDGLATQTAGTFYYRANNQFPGTATFDLNVAVNTFGYNITSIQSFMGWYGNNSQAQANQTYTVDVSLVGSSSYANLATVSYRPFLDVSGANYESHVVLTQDNGTGILASGVDSIRFTFLDPLSATTGVANGAGGNEGTLIRELDVFGAASVPEPSAALLGGLGMLALLRRRRA